MVLVSRHPCVNMNKHYAYVVADEQKSLHSTDLDHLCWMITDAGKCEQDAALSLVFERVVTPFLKPREVQELLAVGDNDGIDSSEARVVHRARCSWEHRLPSLRQILQPQATTQHRACESLPENPMFV